MKRALLDEGVPRPLAGKLRAAGLDVTAFPNGWKQLSNGALLDHIQQQGYEVLITADKNMPYQQNLKGRPIAVLILPTNRLPDVLELASEIAKTVRGLEAGRFHHLNSRRPIEN